MILKNKKFKLTDEQESIIDSTDNLKVEATAGSAKTTTSLMKIERLSEKISAKQKTLYVVFNRSAKDHAKHLVEQMGIHKVQVDTAHSLAFRTIAIPRKLKIRNNYSAYQLVKLLKINEYNGFTKYVMSNHVSKYFSYFCNSSSETFEKYNYIKDLPISEKDSYDFALSNLDKIEKYGQKLYAMMKSKEIDSTHDFYLKEFHLTGKQLPYPQIVFDEAQDASPVMLSSIMNQNKATKTFVGDSNQSIYGFRKAMNALRTIDFEEMTLSLSFRYPSRIAQIGKEILSWKQDFDPEFRVPNIDGVGKSTSLDTHCVIGRTNSEIFCNVVTQIIENKSGEIPYFEGGLNSLLKSDNNIHIFDIVSLKDGKKGNIKNPFMKNFDSFKEFQEYAKRSGENDLKIMIKLVDSYGSKLYSIIKELESVQSDSKDKADIIFSTVHKAKGLEYDRVTLLNDFRDMEMLKKSFDSLSGLEKQDYDNILPILEEINMLYVAATRTKNELNQNFVEI